MHPSWRVMASPNPAAQLNLIRWSHPIHQWSTSAWHPSVPPHRRFLRFFNVAGCEKPSADWIGSNKKQLKNTRIHWLWIQPSIVVYPSLALGWPSTSLGPLVRCCPNSWWGAFGAFKLFQPPICQCWTLPHPSAALLQPSKPPATNTRRSSKPATAQPERPTAMVGPEENVMLVASKILGDWETCVRLDKWTSSWALERRPALQQVAVCKTGIGSVSELLTWWIVAEGSLYSSMCILYVFLPGHSVLKWSALPSKPPKTMIRLEGINKGLHVGVPPKAKGMIRKHHAWTPGLLSTTHWLPKINYKKHKKYIIWFSDTLAPKVCKSIIIHHILHINTNSTQIPSWFLIGTLAEKWQLK